jgi:membrane-bound metal-dependent hydrolase YbcI (DUF457 family)
MDSLFHFLFPVLIALAAKVHVKHEIRNILIVGVLTVLIDLDHYFGLTRATFHNVFITLLLPVIIIIIAFSFKKNYSLKGFSVLLLIFLSSHLFLDLFSEGPVALFYPLSNEYYSFNFNISVPLGSGYNGYLISTMGVGILAYFIIIFLPCLYLDDIIEIMEKRHESFRKALRQFIKLSHPKE